MKIFYENLECINDMPYEHILTCAKIFPTNTRTFVWNPFRWKLSSILFPWLVWVWRERFKDIMSWFRLEGDWLVCYDFDGFTSFFFFCLIFLCFHVLFDHTLTWAQLKLNYLHSLTVIGFFLILNLKNWSRSYLNGRWSTIE